MKSAEKALALSANIKSYIHLHYCKELLLTCATILYRRLRGAARDLIACDTNSYQKQFVTNKYQRFNTFARPPGGNIYLTHTHSALALLPLTHFIPYKNIKGIHPFFFPPRYYSGWVGGEASGKSITYLEVYRADF